MTADYDRRRTWSTTATRELEDQLDTELGKLVDGQDLEYRIGAYEGAALFLRAFEEVWTAGFRAGADNERRLLVRKLK